MGIRILIPRRRRHGSVRKTRTFVWAALGVALWGTAYTLFGAGGMVGSMRARADVERLNDEVMQAENANRQLRQRIDALRNDPQSIERHAREQLYLAKPGEKVYLLPPAEEVETETPAGSGLPFGEESPDDPRR